MSQRHESKENKPAPAQANWKIRPETLKRINQACLDRDVTQAVLADIALDLLENKPQVRELVVPVSADSDITPKDDEQRRVLIAALLCLNDKKVPEDLKTLKCALQHWLKQVPQGKERKGKSGKSQKEEGAA